MEVGVHAPSFGGHWSCPPRLPDLPADRFQGQPGLPNAGTQAEPLFMPAARQRSRERTVQQVRDSSEAQVGSGRLWQWEAKGKKI